MDDAIAALPAVDDLTLENADAVSVARTAYEALTDAQKPLVTKLSVLEAAEAKIADLTAANAVDEQIADLPAVDELTLDNADAVTAARTAYNALTDTQKPLVTKLSVLEAAEAKIADLTAANAVDEQIADLPAVDELTLDDVDDVAAARTAYNALTDVQKPLVTKLDVLTAAEAKIAELQQQAEDRAAAQPVIDAIAALPAIDELTLNDANDVAAARTTYNTLTDAQKAYVTNYETLTTAEAKITDLTAANAVDEQIADLPAVDQLTLDDANDVADARAAYDALSDAQQALVTNYSVLKAAEQKIADLQQAAADQAAAQPVIDAIAALQPTDELTLDDADEVAAARSAYDALTDAQKALVTNYETLAAAEAKIASIHIPLTDAVVKVTSKVYNGKAQTPQVTVTLNGAQLTEGTDFTVADGTFTNVGTYEVTVTGTGKYEGTATGTFTITPKAVTVTANDLSKTYGEADPELTADRHGHAQFRQGQLHACSRRGRERRRVRHNSHRRGKAGQLHRDVCVRYVHHRGQGYLHGDRGVHRGQDLHRQRAQARADREGQRHEAREGHRLHGGLQEQHQGRHGDRHHHGQGQLHRHQVRHVQDQPQVHRLRAA